MDELNPALTLERVRKCSRTWTKRTREMLTRGIRPPSRFRFTNERKIKCWKKIERRKRGQKEENS